MQKDLHYDIIFAVAKGAGYADADAKSPSANLPPNIGHAEVFHQPDEISTKWIDERFGKKKTVNSERALAAAESIFELIKKGNAKWGDIQADFETFMDAEDLDKRVNLVKSRYPDIERYDEDSWLNEALKFSRDTSEIPEYDVLTGNPKPTKARDVDISIRDIDSHWLRFQQAAKKQLASVLELVKAL